MGIGRLLGATAVGFALLPIGPLGMVAAACIGGAYLGFKDVSDDRVKAAQEHQRMYRMLHEHGRADFSGALVNEGRKRR